MNSVSFLETQDSGFSQKSPSFCTFCVPDDKTGTHEILGNKHTNKEPFYIFDFFSTISSNIFCINLVFCIIKRHFKTLKNIRLLILYFMGYYYRKFVYTFKFLCFNPENSWFVSGISQKGKSAGNQEHSCGKSVTKFKKVQIQPIFCTKIEY